MRLLRLMALLPLTLFRRIRLVLLRRPPFFGMVLFIEGVNPFGVMKVDCERVLGKDTFLFSVLSSVFSDSKESGPLFLFTYSAAEITVGEGVFSSASASASAEREADVELEEFTNFSMLSRFCGFSRRVGDPPAGISKVLGKWVMLSEPFRLVFASSSLSSKTTFFSFFFFFNCVSHMGRALLQAPHQLAKTTSTVPQPLDNTLSRLFVIAFDFI